MTVLLSRAFEKASVLPESLQDELARELLSEIEGEQQWDASLANSAGKLDQLAQQAIQEFHSGKTIKTGFDSL